MSIYLNTNKPLINYMNLYRSKYFVDKSLMIEKLNEVIETSDKYICITRPRRFGKSSVIDMLGSYYSIAVDSKDIFDNLKISNSPSYSEHLNKYNVINISFNDLSERGNTYEDYIEMIRASITKDIVEKYNIEIVPLNVAFGDDIYTDGEIEKDEFYKMMANSPVLPKTSCPSPERFMRSYEGEEDEILVITLASKLSGTYSTAVLAKNMFEEEYPNKKVTVIDTETGSIGQGLLIVKAAQLAEEGKSLDEIVNIIESIKKDVVFYGSLETLENAIKGGRINALAGKLINALNFKVIVKIGNGEVKPCDKARGDNNSMKKVVENVCDSIKEGEVKSLAIAHANCLDKALKVKEMMLKNHDFESVMISDLGAVMGTYTSKGAILISVL